MPEDGYDSEPPVLVWDHNRFRDSIVTGVKTHELPYSELPSEISLQGSIGSLVDKVIDTTLREPGTPEYGTYGKVSHEGKLLLSQTLTKGTNDRVTIRQVLATSMPVLTPHYARHEYPALDIHSHGADDIPPSPIDLLNLLKPAEEGGSQSSIIVTPENRYLLYRSIKTPDLTIEKSQRIYLQISR